MVAVIHMSSTMVYGHTFGQHANIPMAYNTFSYTIQHLADMQTHQWFMTYTYTTQNLANMKAL